ncbi:DUF6520 family protein [Cellulophaga sp. Hel_I_12]|uniref:DUF6520 family protein n=1 Tax=Cellulophaga sp. Hel_I_12 TaxID=1249972 RepID=UPI000648E607|nr:DUF6520 family protein [Cellulophaga sp. Hel_I_12]
MKRTFFKTVLPAFAILLAVGLSFATTTETISDPAYYNHPVLGVQPVPGGSDCPIEGTIPCKFNGFDTFVDPALTLPYLRQM